MQPTSPRIRSLSERLYRYLLLVYPVEFRRIYGQQMVQTFCDCYRNAVQQAGPSRTSELARLWSFILYDLAVTASSEHGKASVTFFKRLFGLEKEYVMSTSLLNLDIASRTDRGRTRANNEDTMASIVPQDPQILAKKGALFVVADGIGGHTQGDVASDMVVNAVRDTHYADAQNDTTTSLQRAIEYANTLVYRLNEAKFQAASVKDEQIRQQGMGTTCVAAVLQGDRVYIANVGDSLAYIMRNGKVRQIAENHSWVAEQVRTGAMTEAGARAQGKNPHSAV